jgi:hypothetical protein
LSRPRGGDARAVAALWNAWLLLDFFGDARRRGEAGGATLTTTIFGQTFVAFVFAAMVFDDRIGHVAFAAANLTLTSLLVAFSLFADPPRRERRDADRTLVDTAPHGHFVRRIASIVHGSFFVTWIALGTAIPAAVLTTWVVDPEAGGPSPMLAALVHLVGGVACAGIAAGAVQLVLAIATLRGSLQTAALAAGTVRALILGGGFAAFALGLRHLDERLVDLPFPEALVRAFPPYHAARWAAAPGELVWPALLVGTLLALLLLAALIERIGEGRHARDAAGSRERRPGMLERLARSVIGPRPELLGVEEFTARMLLRSPGFRARVLPLIGLPAAMAGLATLETDPTARRVLLGAVLQFPAIYLPFLIVFLPTADEPKAAHVFATAPDVTVPRIRTAALVALTTRLLVPLFAVAVIVVPLLGTGLVASLSMVVFTAGLAVLVTDLRVHGLQGVPFTRSPDAGSGGGEDALGGLMFAALVLAGLGGAHARFAEHPLGIAAAVALALAAVLVVRARCRRPAEAEPAAVITIPTESVDRALEPPSAGSHPGGTVATGERARARPAAPNAEAGAPAAPSLRRELLAIAALYIAMTALPLVVGTFLD